MAAVELGMCLMLAAVTVGAGAWLWCEGWRQGDQPGDPVVDAATTTRFAGAIGVEVSITNRSASALMVALDARPVTTLVGPWPGRTTVRRAPNLEQCHVVVIAEGTHAVVALHVDIDADAPRLVVDVHTWNSSAGIRRHRHVLYAVGPESPSEVVPAR